MNHSDSDSKDEQEFSDVPLDITENEYDVT